MRTVQKTDTSICQAFKPVLSYVKGIDHRIYVLAALALGGGLWLFYSRKNPQRLVDAFSPDYVTLKDLEVSIGEKAIKNEFNGAILNATMNTPYWKQHKGTFATRTFYMLYHLTHQLLLEEKKVGVALDNGDCFFDAFAQQLIQKAKQEETITVHQLRCDVAEYIEGLEKGSKEDNWVYHAIAFQGKGSEESKKASIERYRNLKKTPNTKDEEEEDEEEHKIPIWGDAICAKILATVYQVDVRIYTVCTAPIEIYEMINLPHNRTFRLPKSDHGVHENQFYDEQVVLEDEPAFIIPHNGKKKAERPVIELALIGDAINGHFMPVLPIS